MRYLLLTVFALIAAVSQVQADWPCHNGPDRNAIINPGNLASDWPADGPPELWRKTLGHGFGGPAIVDGKVYVLDRVGNEQDKLRCLDLKSGRELWHYAYAAPGKLSFDGSRATPTVDGDLVYTIGPFGHILCFNAKTRRPVWKAHLLDDFKSASHQWGVAQSPVIYKDLLIIAPCGKNAGVVAMNKKTGRVRWRSKPIGNLEYNSPILTTLHGADQIIQQTKKNVAGIDLKTGRILWQYDGYYCKWPVPSPTPIGDGRIFITGGYNAGSQMIRVTRTASGFTAKKLWEIEKIGAHVHNAIHYKDHLYMLCNTNERKDGLVCVDLDGNIKWQTGRASNFDKGGLLIADDSLYIVEGRKGTVHLVDPNPAAFKQIAESRKLLDGKQIWSPPALSDGKLVVRDQGQIKCLDVSKKIQP